jgi:hypothetical protein
MGRSAIRGSTVPVSDRPPKRMVATAEAGAGPARAAEHHRSAAPLI